MAKMKITVGDLVEISQISKNVELEPYVSVVEDFDNKDTVLIYSPKSFGFYIQLPKNREYSVRIMSRTGIFRFDASINRYISRESLEFTELKVLGEGERIQQREFFRLPYSIPMNFSIRTEDESEKSFSDEIYEGEIRDLSGGGIKIVTKSELALNDLIRINLQLDKDSYALTGEVRFRIENLDAVNSSYTYGVMFMGLYESKREKILSFLHDLQIRAMQPGKEQGGPQSPGV